MSFLMLVSEQYTQMVAKTIRGHVSWETIRGHVSAKFEYCVYLLLSIKKHAHAQYVFT